MKYKFRAWDKDSKRMKDWNSLLNIRYGDNRLIDKNVDDNLFNDPDHILMQFTGLLDRHGKEIWEGDIVNVDRQDSFPSYNRAIIGYADNYGSFLLQYTKQINPKGVLAQGNSITSNHGKILYGYCTGWELEVIGNIYENPKLLEKTK